MVEEKCNINEIFIEQYADRELDFKESAEVLEHIENCVECREKLDRLLFTRSMLTAYNEKEKMTFLEKEGIFRFIDRENNRKTFFQILILFIKGHGFSVTAGAFALVSILFSFVFSLFQLEKENRLILDEIIASHNNTLPDDFVGVKGAEDELNKNFRFKNGTIRDLAKISPNLSGRFTSIAASMAAKINLDGQAEGKGSLFMSKKNDRIKNLFKNSSCIVKNSHHDCKAKLLKEKDNDIVFWEELENDFVFVSSSRDMTNKMIRLIDTE